MKEADKTQAVINTLEALQITSTYDNVNKLLGIYQTLAEVRDKLREGDGNGVREE